MKVAEFYDKFTDDRIDDLIVVPPYESNSKDGLANKWVKGAIKHKINGDGYPVDLVITAPKLVSCFRGCQWNKIVFGVPKDSDDTTNNFRAWLSKLQQKLKNTISEQPEKYKPGTRTATRFQFEEVLKPSSDPDRYPDELRCKLSVKRDVDPDEHHDTLFDASSERIEIVDADLFSVENGCQVAVDPQSLAARTPIQPVFKVSYFRHGDKFGLVFTILRAQVFPSDNYFTKTANSEWQIDTPEHAEILEPTPKRPRHQEEQSSQPANEPLA